MSSRSDTIVGALAGGLAITVFGVLGWGMNSHAISLIGDGALVLVLGWLARRVIDSIDDLMARVEQLDKRITELERRAK